MIWYLSLSFFEGVESGKFSWKRLLNTYGALKNYFNKWFFHNFETHLVNHNFKKTANAVKQQFYKIMKPSLNLLAKFLKIKVEKFTLHQRKELYQRN